MEETIESDLPMPAPRTTSTTAAVPWDWTSMWPGTAMPEAGWTEASPSSPLSDIGGYANEKGKIEKKKALLNYF